MQSLREEEEKTAEEEAVDDFPLTYDRPDLCNKVTLRRSSTGMWKVCSSGQIFENDLSCFITEKSQKPTKNIEPGTVSNASNKRVLRSGKSYTERNSVRSLGDLKNDDPDYALSEQHQDACVKEDSTVQEQSSPRSLGESLKVPGLSLTSCSNNVDDESFHESMDPKTLGTGAADPVVFCRDSSVTPSDGSSPKLCMEFLTHNIPSVNHKHLSRQNPVRCHDDAAV